MSRARVRGRGCEVAVEEERELRGGRLGEFGADRFDGCRGWAWEGGNGDRREREIRAGSESATLENSGEPSCVACENAGTGRTPKKRGSAVRRRVRMKVRLWLGRGWVPSCCPRRREPRRLKISFFQNL